MQDPLENATETVVLHGTEPLLDMYLVPLPSDTLAELGRMALKFALLEEMIARALVDLDPTTAEKNLSYAQKVANLKRIGTSRFANANAHELVRREFDVFTDELTAIGRIRNTYLHGLVVSSVPKSGELERFLAWNPGFKHEEEVSAQHLVNFGQRMNEVCHKLLQHSYDILHTP